MCITSEDPNDLEERRLCYVGITRAMKDLTMTGAQMRMVRGETHYNKVSRFMQEIPEDVLEVKGGRQASANRSGENAENERDSGNEINRDTMFDQSEEKISAQKKCYQQAREAFRARAFEPKQFQVKKADRLDYVVGDTVSHIKFGKGVVKSIVEGGRDYEVTVEFEKAGVKKMFAAFAKLKKCN